MEMSNSKSDMPGQSWLSIDPRSHFSIHNIPFGIISTSTCPKPRPAIAIGTYTLDLKEFAKQDGFQHLPVLLPHLAVLSQPTLNDFAALGRPMHRAVREYLQDIFKLDGPYSQVLQNNDSLRQAALVEQSKCTMHLPMRIGDYTDFYAGLHHAYTLGVLFRGPANALQPNYKHLPVGYHGRASSIVVSGTAIRRPNGQILTDPAAVDKIPVLSPSKKLDIELELGCFVCKPTQLGESVPIETAPDHLFGMVLLNDWSARDIQAWEYVPLGPFNSKNFATSISPWVVLADALQPFATHGIANDVPVLPYLSEGERKSHYDIDLTVSIKTSSGAAAEISQTTAKNLLFSFPQMLTHHTVGGCPFNVGDLLGSGTISGETQTAKGALIELTRNGTSAVELANSETRIFLEDGDTMTLSGVCGTEDGALVGFGECVGQILPALRM